MKILITGAAGLVGSHCVGRWSREHDVLALDHRALDITDASAVQRCVSDRRPDLIVNGAVVQVDEAESNPARARAVNVDGPRILAEAINESGGDMLHFSTQYAFGGEPLHRAPYTIADQPDPINNYGRSKVAGEQALVAACPRSYIVRTSWVYGAGKNSFLCTVPDDLRSGRPVRAIDDIWSSTTYVADLLDRCTEIAMRRHYGTYHIVNEGICSYFEFALEAGRLAGLPQNRIDELIQVTHERDMKRVAVRPRYTPMRCQLSETIGLAPMRGWKAALADYVAGQ